MFIQANTTITIGDNIPHFEKGNTVFHVTVPMEITFNQRTRTISIENRSVNKSEALNFPNPMLSRKIGELLEERGYGFVVEPERFLDIRGHLV